MQLCADEQRLKQMLVNLLSNAVKFTPSGGQVSLRVTPDAAAGVIHFAVQDTGPGIAPADQARLFQPFIQIDRGSPASTRAPGWGWPWSSGSPSSMAAACGWTAPGIAGQGCRFTITLPRVTDRRIMPTPTVVGPLTPDISAALGVGPAILLVEDNEVTIDATSGYLERLGYRVQVARTGPEAITCAQDMRPGLILMDIQPLRFGLEVTTHACAPTRALPPRQSSP